ncbi:MAG: hypothetical protein QOK30_3010 [Nocardioidaceae bacterium]|jgi:hypothetical protein|nr:hypothetical protein [Nocardioidaceae bacterium]MDX6367934.1 hypothetical protein [Nocardioidaceae bacterium]
MAIMSRKAPVPSWRSPALEWQCLGDIDLDVLDVSRFQTGSKNPLQRKT